MKVDGMSAFRAALKDRRERMASATEDALSEAAGLVSALAVAKLVEKQHPRGTPTPSMPGEPPAMITGALAQSVHTSEISHDGNGRYEIQVGPTEVYSRIQELGGTAGRGAHLPARPYLKPAVEDVKPEVRRVFKDKWSDA